MRATLVFSISLATGMMLSSLAHTMLVDEHGVPSFVSVNQLPAQDLLTDSSAFDPVQNALPRHVEYVSYAVRL